MTDPRFADLQARELAARQVLADYHREAAEQEPVFTPPPSASIGSNARNVRAKRTGRPAHELFDGRSTTSQPTMDEWLALRKRLAARGLLARLFGRT